MPSVALTAAAGVEPSVVAKAKAVAAAAVAAAAAAGAVVAGSLAAAPACNKTGIVAEGFW